MKIGTVLNYLCAMGLVGVANCSGHVHLPTQDYEVGHSGNKLSFYIHQEGKDGSFQGTTIVILDNLGWDGGTLSITQVDKNRDETFNSLNLIFSDRAEDHTYLSERYKKLLTPGYIQGERFR